MISYTTKTQKLMTYKFLIIQENGRHEANRKFRECFCIQRALTKLGHEAQIYGLNHNNENIDFGSYDVILNLENYDTGWVPNLSNFKSYKILWSIDAHCKGIDPYRQEFHRGKYDLVLQATPEHVKDIDKSIWFPNCFDDTLIYPRGSKQYHIGFCGNFPTLDRQVFLENLSKVFTIKKDIFVIGEAMVDAINSYQIHWNKNMSYDINYRNFETLGCQTLLLTNYSKHYDKLGLKNMENCLIYTDFASCIRLINDIDDNEIARIAKNGLELSKQHTYEQRFSKLIDDILV